MKFFDILKNKGKKPEEDFNNIGESNPICPYCNTPLDKMPKRKRNCPSCKNEIYVRTRPLDEKKILIREEQIDELERQWAIKNGTLDQYNRNLEEKAKEKEKVKTRFENKKAQLTNQFGYEPKENDIKWALFNEDRIYFAGDGKYGLYRNTTMYMANQLNKEKRFSDALNFYLEVCYWDINEPTNEGYFYTDPKIIAQHRIDFGNELEPMNPKIPPAIIEYIKKIQKTETINIDDLKARFIQITKRITAHSNMKPPITPEKAWLLFENEYENLS
ncbi:MAG: hypothetical protein PHI15_08520 [Methanomicrobium sp.]|nr:hypothetical protein [Methanomicrobium sp.]